MRTGDKVVDTTEASSPQCLELVEKVVRLTHGVHLTAHALLAPLPTLAHQTGAFEHGYVFLHCGEAHRIAPGQVGHGVLALQDERDDIPAGGVGERVENLVGSDVVQH